MSTHTPAWINRAAVAIINRVDANPAMNFEAKNSTAANIARVISEHDQSLELFLALMAAYDELHRLWGLAEEGANHFGPSDAVVQSAVDAIHNYQKGQP